MTESVFEGGFSVLANWNRQAVEVEGARLAPHGFLARKGERRARERSRLHLGRRLLPGGAR